jgi:hypothetical protein
VPKFSLYLIGDDKTVKKEEGRYQTLASHSSDFFFIVLGFVVISNYLFLPNVSIGDEINGQKIRRNDV